MSVAPPSQGLGSNFNYFFANGGNAITGLNVEITFAEPLISTANGFGFQLNAYAQELPNATSTTPNWQQYLVLNLQDDNTLFAFIDNWEGTFPAGTYNEVINDLIPVTTLATNNEIPAGAIVNIAPTFSSTNVIIGVTFMYTPPGGKTVSTSITLTDLDVFGTLENVTSAYESPISAFTLNIVGDLDGSNGVFTSGSGTIVYKADQPLTVLSTEPSYTSFQDGTGETANTVYGELPVSNSTTITQTWGLSAAGAPSLGLGIGHKLRIAPGSKQKGRRSLPISRHIVRMNKAKYEQVIKV